MRDCASFAGWAMEFSIRRQNSFTIVHSLLGKSAIQATVHCSLVQFFLPGSTVQDSTHGVVRSVKGSEDPQSSRPSPIS